MSGQVQIPNGYRSNAIGHLVPEANISEIDKIRDGLVIDMINEAKARASEMAAFSRMCHGRVSSFVELAAQDYGVSMVATRAM